MKTKTLPPDRRRATAAALAATAALSLPACLSIHAGIASRADGRPEWSLGLSIAPPLPAPSANPEPTK